MLTLLRGIDSSAYNNLAREFRVYAACVGLVDTGYFRKRSRAMANLTSASKQKTKSKVSRDEEYMEPVQTRGTTNTRLLSQWLQKMRTQAAHRNSSVQKRPALALLLQPSHRYNDL